MSRDDILKEVMARLMGGDAAVDVLDLDGDHDEHAEDINSGVRDSLNERRTHLSMMPNEDSPEKEILQLGLKKIDETAKRMFKEARLAELQEEAAMLTKPDDFDLEAPENEHIRLHIEERSIFIEIRKREALIFRRFHDILKKSLLE